MNAPYSEHGMHVGEPRLSGRLIAPKRERPFETGNGGEQIGDSPPIE